MSKIGSFTKVADEYRGEIETLTIRNVTLRLVPIEATSDKAPNYRAFVGESDVGAAWWKHTTDDRPYLSVRLDDPAFVAPMYAQLRENTDGGLELVWNRPTRRKED